MLCCTGHATAQGDEWEIVTSDGGEVLHMQYGSEVDDFDPVTQARRLTAPWGGRPCDTCVRPRYLLCPQPL